MKEISGIAVGSRAGEARRSEPFDATAVLIRWRRAECGMLAHST